MEKDNGSDSSITVQVKFAGRTIPVSLSSAAAAVKELKSLLQPLTNVLPRGQKLIFKGKVLEDASVVSSNGIINGSKIMLVATQGLHQGDGPIKNSSPSNARNILVKNDTKPQKIEVIQKNRSERWKITGVIALSDCQLRVVPEEVWSCGAAIRILDLSTNFIQEIPMNINALVSVKKIVLNGNNLSEESICWEGLVALKSLSYLSLNNNRLTNLPSLLGEVISLHELHVANNKLTNLPDEIESLKQLEIFEARNNRISSLPKSIGNCKSLIEIDMSYNLLTELPKTLERLKYLKALHLRNNGLKSLPSTLFKGCSHLSLLDLHGTEITNDILRQVEGWEDFDERRRSKHQKQIDFRVGSSGSFDEGADDNNKHF